MSWNSERFGAAECKHWLNSPSGESCEHLKVPADKRPEPYAVFCEDDTFGTVLRNVVCEPCYDKELDREHWEPCVDCKKRKPYGQKIGRAHV